ncbi:flagellar assembly protein FliW [Euzebya sp.]|uniref:flagellar assembly protein FliW n=1 Tax=Euzebya sp. TaxID=1971409 RepID=UPI00351318DD
MTAAATTLEFVTAVPGFPEARAWTLETWGDDANSPFKVLTADDVADLAFVVVDPFGFFPDYEPTLDTATVDALGLGSADDADVYVVLTVGETLQDTTANLLGPVVVNRTNGRAVQAILHQPGLSTRAPLAS